MEFNIIFLDIDGVINTPNYGVQAHATWVKTNGWFKSRDEYGALFDPISVACLEYLAYHTDAKVVISSSWRSKGLKVMKEMFEHRKIDIEVVDITPILENEIRGKEIEKWLSDNCDYVKNYVILDDHMDFTQTQIQEHYVCTKGKYGFEHNAMAKALEILIKKI